MNILLHRSWKELQPLAADWNRVLAESCSDTIFLTWEWCLAWWKAYGGGRSLFLLTAWDGAELVGVAPFYADLARRGFGSWTYLRIIGGASGDSDYLDCFIKRGLERQVLVSFVEFLESMDSCWDWIHIDGIPKDSPCLAALGEIAAERGWSFASEDIAGAALRLPEKWDDYLRSLRPRVRSKVRQALAYFEQLQVSPSQCATTSELDSWLPQLFELHTRRWQQRPGVFRSESRQTFYREVSSSTLNKGWLAFHRLTWGERPLALQYGFRYHKHLYLLQEAYDPSFGGLRPGVALRGWVMRGEIEQGSAEYDFLAGTARHKLDWGLSRNSAAWYGWLRNRARSGFRCRFHRYPVLCGSARAGSCRRRFVPGGRSYSSRGTSSVGKSPVRRAGRWLRDPMPFMCYSTTKLVPRIAEAVFRKIRQRTRKQQGTTH